MVTIIKQPWYHLGSVSGIYLREPLPLLDGHNAWRSTVNDDEEDRDHPREPRNRRRDRKEDDEDRDRPWEPRNRRRDREEDEDDYDDEDDRPRRRRRPSPKDPMDEPGMALILPVNTSVLAIAAGYIGLISVLCIPAPFAFLLGILALIQLKKNPKLHGRYRAIFAIVMGFLFSLPLPFLVYAIIMHK
jgi:hypothetical protein